MSERRIPREGPPRERTPERHRARRGWWTLAVAPLRLTPHSCVLYQVGGSPHGPPCEGLSAEGGERRRDAVPGAVARGARRDRRGQNPGLRSLGRRELLLAVLVELPSRVAGPGGGP